MYTYPFVRFSSAILIMVPLIVLSPAVASEAEQTWPTMTPEEAGFSSLALADALKTMRQRDLHIHSLTIIRHGKQVLDARFYPYDGKLPHNLASVTKSVMTTLIAIAAEQGKLSLDAPMLSFFPNRSIANRDERKERITVRHLTGMMSGLACTGEHDEPQLHEMNASADWVQFALDLKVIDEPGSRFSYCSPGMHLLSAILQQATGQTTFDFARANLFAPLGITTAEWPIDPQGVTSGWGDLFLFPEDVAKLGQLWLMSGQWQGKQIVSGEWVGQSAKLQIATGPLGGDGYGYGWWIRQGSPPGYDARGRGGQQVSVFPTLDAVVVTTGAGLDPGEALSLIGNAFVSPEQPLAPEAEGARVLETALTAITESPPPQPVPPLPPAAAAITGKIYRLAPNPLRLATFKFSFDGSAEAQMSMTFSDGRRSRGGAVGLDGVYRFSAGEGNFPAGMRGHWIDANRFALEYDGIAYIDAFDLVLRFEGKAISIEAKERTYESGITLTGEY
jgi:CubicO group peptidase (beta-lactamase class C family)